MPHCVIASFASIPGILSDIYQFGVPKLPDCCPARSDSHIRFFVLCEDMAAALAAWKLKRSFFPQDPGHQPSDTYALADYSFFAKKQVRRPKKTQVLGRSVQVFRCFPSQNAHSNISLTCMNSQTNRL